MQSGFPTANLPRSADTAAAVDRHSATGRPSGDAARRHDNTDSTRESAFSDMVETARSTEATPVRKPAGQAKAGERAVPSDAANTGNAPASGQPAPAPATDAPADVQDMAATGQKQTQAKSAEADKPAAPQPASTPDLAGAQTGSTSLAPTAPASGSNATSAPVPAAQTQPAPDSAPATTEPRSGTTPVTPAASEAARTPDRVISTTAEASPDATRSQGGTATPVQAPENRSGQPSIAPPGNSAPTGTAAPQDNTASADAATPSAVRGSDAAPADAPATPAPTKSATPTPPGGTPGAQVQVALAGKQTTAPATTARSVVSKPDPAMQAAGTTPAADGASGTTGKAPVETGTPASGSTATTASAENTAQQAGQTQAPLREASHRPAILETGGNTASAKSSNGKSAAPAGQRVPTTPTGQGSAQSNATVESTNVTPVSPQRDPSAPAMSPLMQALAQPAGTADQAPVQPLEIDADATQSDAEIQLNRTGDVRAPVDRAGANLPRFAPHTAQHLAGQITRQFNNGQRVFDIRLDPAELGKVDVRLELRADNRVHAVLSAERPETLAELQRAARDLERSLNEAGLELAEEGLTFQLRDEGGDTPGSQRDPSATTMPIFAEGGEIGLTDEATAPIVQQSKYGFLLSRRSGVDMRV